MALRKIDIKRWGSPVATQFGIRSLPYFHLYDESGSLVGSGGSRFAEGQIINR